MISFDVPSTLFRGKPFEARYRHLLRVLSPEHPFSVCPPLRFFPNKTFIDCFCIILLSIFNKVVSARVMCVSAMHQQAFSQSIIDDEGEGVILRRCGSLYLHGRSRALIKLKVSFLLLSSFPIWYCVFVLYFVQLLWTKQWAALTHVDSRWLTLTHVDSRWLTLTDVDFRLKVIHLLYWLSLALYIYIYI